MLYILYGLANDGLSHALHSREAHSLAIDHAGVLLGIECIIIIVCEHTMIIMISHDLCTILRVM